MKISTRIESQNGKILDLEKVGIIYNIEHESAQEVADMLEKTLISKGFPVITKNKICEKGDKTSISTDIGLVFVVGGDGTFLGAARHFSPYNVPLFGINTGRLGFLSQLKPSELEAGVEKILAGEFKIDERLMIRASSQDKSRSCTALNDIVIKSGEISRTVQLFLYINGRHVCDYLADGLIISTPTGSTAYTLSAGGPVVVPELESFVIVPICPHSLTTRPIVIPADEKIEVRVKIKSDYITVTGDGQEVIKIEADEPVLITKNSHKARLITLQNENNGFYSILREKLHWGISPHC